MAPNQNGERGESREERLRLLAVLDGVSEIIYVADPVSFELLYVNKAFELSWGSDVLGRKCHEVLQGRQAPCPFCTNDLVFGKNLGKVHVWEFQNEITKRWYRCADRAIDWGFDRKVRMEIAADITELKSTEFELKERLKELNCLLEIGRIVEKHPDSVETILEMAVNVLPAAWQHPDRTVAEIQFGERSFETGEIIACQNFLEQEIRVNQEARGSVRVGVVNSDAEADQDPFLVEERELIKAIAERLGHVLERIEMSHALREHQQRLEEQVRQRTKEFESQSRKATQLATELSVIMDSVPGLVFYKDKANRYVRVNRYVADAHKMTKSELEGKDCFELYPRDQAQAYFEDDLQVIERGESKLNIEELWHTEAGTKWISTSKIPYVDEAGQVQGVIGVAMDITERKLGEQALERKSLVTSGINRVFREALSCDTAEAVAQNALHVAEELTGSRFGFIGEINANGKLDTIGISNPGWDACSVEGSVATQLITNMELRGIWATSLRNQKSQIVNDPDTLPDRVGVPKGHPRLERFLGVPLIRRGRAVGIIALANKSEDYTELDREAVEALAAPVYETIERKRLELKVQEQSQIDAARAQLSNLMAGDPGIEPLCAAVVRFICKWLHVPTGLLHVAESKDMLRLRGAFAFQSDREDRRETRLGQGLVGQAALDRQEILLDDLPEDYFQIGSGLGQMLPRGLLIKPVVHNDRLYAVLELGLIRPLDSRASRFLEAVQESVAVAVESAQARASEAFLLADSRRMNEELQAQQEELRASNEELEEQTQRLQDSEARLKVQQEELQVTNEELEEKTEMLEQKNRDVEKAREDLMKKARELARASKYKSEFLANMSHELRTPLNSLLLLARSLTENKQGNLTEKQMESVNVIYQSGNELLTLINEILDLAKIEAGRLDLRLEKVSLAQVAESLRSAFASLAEQKALRFSVELDSASPDFIKSDRQRVEQVLKNLISNAIKFTHEGHVRVRFAPAAAFEEMRPGKLDPSSSMVILVEDTGIGIPAEQQQFIFEAFQQGDGGTSRKYGGTGLGLSIVRELVAALGGEIQLKSKAERGAVFALFLPICGKKDPPREKPRVRHETSEAVNAAAPSLPFAPRMQDDREQIADGDRCMLVIEDDLRFAEILAAQCRDRGFKVLAASTGEEGVDLARRFIPKGVLLDLKLPAMDGWRVLDLLKESPGTRHVPVHILSGDEPTVRAQRKGAVGFMQKPLSSEQICAAIQRLEDVGSRRVKRVLVVDDDEVTRKGVVELLSEPDVTVVAVSGGKEAVEKLRSSRFDCMVLDLGLWDMDGQKLLETVGTEDEIVLPPVIVCTARDLTWEQDLNLRKYSDSIIIKGVTSDERLLDEVSLFLHRVVADLPEKKRQVISNLHDVDALLRDKTVLLVDDDMRALFALTSILSEHGMRVLKAENGERALAMLEQEGAIDGVLMDIMMPVLDGYETMKRIRAQERFNELPIIALTAKAMRGDQERCIEAGASDYLSKPVDQDRLLSMLRVWLYR